MTFQFARFGFLLLLLGSLQVRGQDVSAPKIVSVNPQPGTVAQLNRITVTFSELVGGVDAMDLLLNGYSPTLVTNAGAVFTFFFEQPAYGDVFVRWDEQHGITDLARPANHFNHEDDANVWQYTLQDRVAPQVARTHPPAGVTVRELKEVEVTFNEPVVGIQAADLLVNGVPATNVIGFDAGPYRFEFPQPSGGSVQFTWAAGHGIEDEWTNRFGGGSGWATQINPANTQPKLVINEILAANATGLKDENNEAEDWIEIYNAGSSTVNLNGWSLTDDRDFPGQWVFPAVNLPGGGYMVVFASGLDRRPLAGRLHTNFKLSAEGEYLALHSPDAPRAAVSEISFPAQRNDYSYGILTSNEYVYFAAPTPGAANSSAVLTNAVADPHFNVERGFFNTPFNLVLTCPTEGAGIRYTTNGTPPTEAGGLIYNGPILINRLSTIRAAAFKAGSLPSRIVTHTYLYGVTEARRTIPALSIVTANSNLFGARGIMEINPRNTDKHGIAWERPVSAELIRTQDNGGFQIDAGLRIQGGAYVRARYDPNGGLPFSKYSFRLYFRGDYGKRELDYPLFGDIPVQIFDRIVLRAGMNDHSNPFIRDELSRRLMADMGQVASHGMHVTFYLNGVYKGYYNPTERIDKNFLQSWHGGTNEWDLIAQAGEIREGTAVEWNALRTIMGRDISNPTNYMEISRRLDLVNFIDYLLVNIYGATGDWPHNNWRAARERKPGALFRFYLWDAEWTFGFRNPVTHNTLNVELGSSTDIGNFYRKLRANEEFRVLFADRVHKHFFNNGALASNNVTARFNELRNEMRALISGMDLTIQSSWIPNRPRYAFPHLTTAGLFLSTNAPVFNQHGGLVKKGFQLSMTARQGDIYFTTNGIDPRLTGGGLSPEAIKFTSPITLNASALVKARTLTTNWSALTEAYFQTASLGSALRISELMYNPASSGGPEFIEIVNTAPAVIPLGGMRVDGVGFVFPQNSFAAPGEVIVLVNEDGLGVFQQAYPGVKIRGLFPGSLANNGERIALISANGDTLESVDYQDGQGWPFQADGSGYSAERSNLDGDPDDPSHWRASIAPGGSPGRPIAAPAGALVISEIFSGPGLNGWVELQNNGEAELDISGFTLSSAGLPSIFSFPAGTKLPSKGRAVISFNNNGAGFRTSHTLSTNGDALFVSDPLGRVQASASYGLLLPDKSLGLVSNEWRLCEPTLGESNRAAALAAATQLWINEWMAASLPGQSDWLELFNRDQTLPVSLHGLYLKLSNTVFQARSHSFIAPGGFLRLQASETPGPDQLDFRLPATGGVLTLLDSFGVEIQKLSFGRQTEGVSQGFLPDGSTTLVSFPGSASPGSPNYLISYTGPRINEIMARNTSFIRDSNARFSDWIEIVNGTTGSFDLSGFALSTEASGLSAWTFPPQTILPAGGYLVVWFDSNRPASTQSGPNLNSGLGLSAEGGLLLLLNPIGQVVQRIDYGFQIADRTIGAAANNPSAWTLLAAPTPAQMNSPGTALGAPGDLRINEWSATGAGDWFELYNTGLQPISLSGLYFTDDPSIVGATNFQAGPLSFIDARGFVKWVADGETEKGPNHVNFSLDELGELIRVYSPTRVAIDSIEFGLQLARGSEGRLPDGAATIAGFVDTPTPGESNYLPLETVVINEILTHTDPPLEDAIELFNAGQTEVNMGGWHLSDDTRNLKKFRIPDGTILAAGAYKVFYAADFTQPAPVAFNLDSVRGETLCLSAFDASGQFTGRQSRVSFGAAENGVSFGRILASTGPLYAPMERRAFGKDTPASLADFRQGGGLPNSGPLTGPVLISEIMYNPYSAGSSALEGELGEFVELRNAGSNPAPLFDPAHPENRWRLSGGVDFIFPAMTTLEPSSYCLVVKFDPAADLSTAAAFRSKYNLPVTVKLLGPYTGSLNDAGDTIELLRPDRPETSGPDTGYVPQLLVEEVEYSDGSPWPPQADGSGYSLQRKPLLVFSNDPINWVAAPPTPGGPTLAGAGLDDDSDSIPNEWELAYQLDPKNAADASLDMDQDGLTNLQEYLAGTDPRNAASGLKLSAQANASQLILRFSAQPGKTYRLLTRDSFGPAPWTKAQDFGPLDTTQTIQIELPLSANLTGRFYHLRTPAE